MWQIRWWIDSGSHLSSKMSLMRNIPWLTVWRDQDYCQSLCKHQGGFGLILHNLLWTAPWFLQHTAGEDMPEGGRKFCCLKIMSYSQHQHQLHSLQLGCENRLSLSLWGVWAEKCFESTGSGFLWIFTCECTLGYLEDCTWNCFRDKAGFQLN